MSGSEVKAMQQEEAIPERNRKEQTANSSLS